MPISEHSLLLVIVFAYAAIIILLATTWLSSGIEPFLRTWLAGTVISLVGAFVSAVFYMKPALWAGSISFGALAIGFSIIALTSFQFRTGHLPLRFFGPIILAVAAATVVAMLSGYVGLSIIIWQAWAAACGVAAAANYWMARGRSTSRSDHPDAFLPCPGHPLRPVFGHPHSRRQPICPRGRTTGRTRRRVSSLSW